MTHIVGRLTTKPRSAAFVSGTFSLQVTEHNVLKVFLEKLKHPGIPDHF